VATLQIRAVALRLALVLCAGLTGCASISADPTAGAAATGGAPVLDASLSAPPADVVEDEPEAIATELDAPVADEASGLPPSAVAVSPATSPQRRPGNATAQRRPRTGPAAAGIPIPAGQSPAHVETAASESQDPQAAGSLLEPGKDPSRLAEAPRHDDLWERIRAGFAMPPLDTPLVAERERWYLANPESLQRMLARGGRYLYFIVEELEKRGMPTELALLPFVESAMNPVALSPAKASGLWQFIPATGKRYELSQNWWVDNRRDVVKSTHAALEYLQAIHEMHGRDWFLALASYNWGENAVARAVQRNRAAGQPADYLSLRMPNETRHYVPKLIALKNILLQARELGLPLPPVPNEPYFATVEKTRPIDLKLAARFAGMQVDEFVALNPAHNRPVIAATRNNLIRLPADRVEGFLDAMRRHEASGKPLASWQPYTLQRGESLEEVARRAGVAPAEVLDANGLSRSARILAGTRLLVPQRQVADESQVEAFAGPRVYEELRQPEIVHVVRPRETLATIARRYNVAGDQIRRLNNLQDPKAALASGTRLLIQRASSQTVLTTENGRRQLVPSDAPARTDAPRRDEPARAAPAARPSQASPTQAAPARAQPTRPANPPQAQVSAKPTSAPAAERAQRVAPAGARSPSKPDVRPAGTAIEKPAARPAART
jgi:membrane-bound lytic murein transglycosylase D